METLTWTFRVERRTSYSDQRIGNQLAQEAWTEKLSAASAAAPLLIDLTVPSYEYFFLWSEIWKENQKSQIHIFPNSFHNIDWRNCYALISWWMYMHLGIFFRERRKNYREWRKRNLWIYILCTYRYTNTRRAALLKRPFSSNSYFSPFFENQKYI